MRIFPVRILSYPSILIFCALLSFQSRAAENYDHYKSWNSFESYIKKEKAEASRRGKSQIISGGIAVLAGVLGDAMTLDPIEKGVYTIFQSVGVGAVGYGSYEWYIGSSDRKIYETLKNSDGFDDEMKSSFLKSYADIQKGNEKMERRIRAITHGLIAALNIYNAQKQTNESFKSTLNFIGGINLLVAINYTF